MGQIQANAGQKQKRKQPKPQRPATGPSPALKALRWLWSAMNGIQFKLALFVGGLIAATILILSYNYVDQQTSILTESYEREAAISRNYISSMVLEINNISQSLIRSEEFRQRVAEQTKALKKFQTVTTTTTVTVKEQEKKVSFLGFKTSLFGLAGTEKVEEKHTETKHSDNYFTNYLSSGDTQVLERNIQQSLQQNGGSLSAQAFAALQEKAKKFLKANRDLTDLQSQLDAQADEVQAQSQGNDAKALEQAKADLADLQEQVAQASGLARKLRTDLDNAVIAHLLESRRQRIRDMGLDTRRFRIQTFPAQGLEAGEVPAVAVDTSIFDPDAMLNRLDFSASLQQSLIGAFAALDQGGVLADIKPTALKEALPDGEMELQALYTPYFEHPASTTRARLLEAKRPFLKDTKEAKAWVWADYIVQEKPIIDDLAKTALDLSKRLKTLRERKPPVPPFEDANFRSLYAKYAKFVTQRKALYDQFLKDHPGEAQDQPYVEAVGSLRDSALEDLVLVRFRADGSDYARSTQTPEGHAAAAKRWQALREWIYSGKSETPTAELKAMFPDGLIGNSRTEAEGMLWQLDTTSLLDPSVGVTSRFKKKSKETQELLDLPRLVLSQNFAGMTRTIVDRTDGLRIIRENRNKAIRTALVIFLFAILIAVAASYFSVRKIKRISRLAKKVGQGDLNVQFPAKGADEIGDLSREMNRTVDGLREREKIKGILGGLVDPVIVTEAMKDLESLRRGSEERITAFFSDVASFSSISEKLTSVELASLLNEYLSAMTQILREHGGILDKYIGDAIVGIFNAPVPVSDHTFKAVSASLKMLAKLDEQREVWKRENRYIPDVHNMHFRIGLNVGPAKVGFMGTNEGASYTMMGDTVNLAARLEAAGKDYGVAVLVADAVQEAVKDRVFSRKLDLVRVKGKSEPVVLYEPIAELSELEAAQEGSDLKKRAASAVLYEEGLELYLKRQWDAAIARFKASEAARGSEDKAAHQLIERCEDYKANPPPADWDGVYTREHK